VGRRRQLDALIAKVLCLLILAIHHPDLIKK
jgi:hypothetical protein